MPDSGLADPRLLSFCKALIAAMAALAVYLAMPAAMEEPARRMAALFTLALGLWVTEAIPLFATSLLVLGLESWWVALPHEAETGWRHEEVFQALSDPVIFLFLGGFILAASVQQERVDVQMAGLLLRAFGKRPWGVMAGVMAVTAFFSMWMSNTATTAMMLVLVQPLSRQIPPQDRFRRGLVLSVPFAANIGGIGTPIGTPPNAILLGYLAQHGQPISFLTWVLLATPLVLGLLLGLWLLLLALFRPQTKQIKIQVEETFRPSFKALTVYLTFMVTVMAWVTSEWHGVPVAVIALLPAAVLTMTGVIGVKQFNSLEWNILVLIAGGIALGEGMMRSGLNDWILTLVPPGLSWYSMAVLLVVVSMTLGTVVSNTVAANLLLPLGFALTAAASDEQRAILAVMIAVSASFGMALPVSTPPNALAYASGEVSSRDIMLVGSLTSFGASVLLVLTGPWIIGFFV